MSVKNDVAALMASDGDYEKKISLLKKAVVSVTKQKQELEARAAELQGEVRTVRQELASQREENLKLHRRLTTVEADLDAERKKSTNFGQNLMKGISSLVAGGEESSGGAHTGAAGSGALARHTGGASSPILQRPRQPPPPPLPLPRQQQLALSPEDVERVVAENEKLLMEVYSLKTKCDGMEAKVREDGGRTKTALEAAHKEVAQQRSLLEATTKACDGLNSECARQRALVAFCQSFFALHTECTTDSDGECRVAFHVAPQHMGKAAFPAPADEVDKMAAGNSKAMREAFDHFATLLDAVSVLLAALREALPRSQRGTIADLRLLTDRLATLQEAHGIEKESLTHLLTELRESIAAAKGPAAQAVDRAACLAEVRDQGVELVSGVLKWLLLMRSHAALLVNSCAAYLPPGQPYTLPRYGAPRSSKSAPDTVTERSTFVHEVVSLLLTLLGSVEGSLGAVQQLLEAGAEPAVAGLLPTEPAQLRAAWLCALLRFWWAGSEAAAGLASSAAGLSAVTRGLCDQCGSGPVRDALSFVVSRVGSLGGQGEGEPRQRRRTAAATRRDFTPVAAPLACVGQEELMHALAAADRAAVTYHSQMCATVLELAGRDDQLRAAQAAAAAADARAAETAAQALATHRAFQEKIELLSEQLARQVAPAAHARR